jgi:hypothetical protein
MKQLALGTDGHMTAGYHVSVLVGGSSACYSPIFCATFCSLTYSFSSYKTYKNKISLGLPPYNSVPPIHQYYYLCSSQPYCYMIFTLHVPCLSQSDPYSEGEIHCLGIYSYLPLSICLPFPHKIFDSPTYKPLTEGEALTKRFKQRSETILNLFVLKVQANWMCCSRAICDNTYIKGLAKHVGTVYGPFV